MDIMVILMLIIRLIVVLSIELEVIYEVEGSSLIEFVLILRFF